MNLQQLNPWNWFKHEESGVTDNKIPVRRDESSNRLSTASNPNSLIRLQNEMDQLFDDVFNSFGMPSTRSDSSSPFSPLGELSNFYRPQIDVSGDKEKYEITLDVPGLKEKDVSIEVKGDVLTIKGQKEEKTDSKDKHYYRVERRYGAFQRTLSLPDDASSDDIKASMKNGVLVLEIPRHEAENKDVKRISIS